jgi:hypothetical protein
MNKDPNYNWFEEAKNAPLTEVIQALGLKQGRQSFGPCPSCGAQTREKGRQRLPIGLTLDRQGWRCFPCGASGTIIGLVSLCLLGTSKAQREEWQQIRQWFASYNWCQAIPGLLLKKQKLMPIKHPQATVEQDHSKALTQFKLEVQDFWENDLLTLTNGSKDSLKAIEWLKSRGFTDQQMTSIGDQRLAKVLPSDTLCPKWARFAGKSWNRSGFQLIFPAFNERGELGSLRARRILGSLSPKNVAPDGAGLFPTARNFIQANDFGRLILESGQKPDWWTETVPLKIVIVEGEPDFLSWAGRVSDADAHPLAVFGIWSGAWTESIAARIPDHSRVTIRTDHDKAGHRYAEKIRASLAKRCEILRTKKRT